MYSLTKRIPLTSAHCEFNGQGGELKLVNVDRWNNVFFFKDTLDVLKVIKEINLPFHKAKFPGENEVTLSL